MLPIIFMFMVEFSGAGGMDSFYIPDSENISNVYEITNFLTLGARMEISFFYIEGRATVLMYPMNDSVTFYPCSLESFFEAGIYWRGLSIGFERDCEHPIAPLMDESIRPYYDRAMYKGFIRYESPKIKL
jgi:hypothetical protein